MKQQPLVLIVDDNFDNLEILGKILRQEKYRIGIATNAKETYSFIESDIPDLIILDIMLPDSNGFDICKKLKSDPKTDNIPIIFISALDAPEYIVKGFEAGCSDYIPKPFHPEIVLVRLKNFLDLYAKKNELIKQRNEFKKINEKFKQAHQEIILLERKNSALAMAVTANHEINQPLMIIRGNIEMLQMSFDDDALSLRQLDRFQKTAEAIERIQQLLNKFKESGAVTFQDYSEDTKMVVLE